MRTDELITILNAIDYATDGYTKPAWSDRAIEQPSALVRETWARMRPTGMENEFTLTITHPVGQIALDFIEWLVGKIYDNVGAACSAPEVVELWQHDKNYRNFEITFRVIE